jgi:hypothetical protein
MVSPASHKLSLWGVDAVTCQLEGSMVDRDAGLGTENFMGSNGFFGAMCTGDINQRGSYAPMGNNASGGEPNLSRICAK